MLLILAAVPLETALLRRELHNAQRLPGRSGPRFHGFLKNQPVLLAHCGVGAVAAAQRLTELLLGQTPRAVLLCGCGGSFPGHDLRNGDLVLATSETHGDLGVATAEGFIPLAELGIPHEAALEPPSAQTYHLDETLLAQARQALPQAASGPFVSVACGSGTPELSRQLQQRTGALCENMEGAAAAQVCATYGIPLLELRAISNPTGTRDPRDWDLAGAARAAQEGLLRILAAWPAQTRKD